MRPASRSNAAQENAQDHLALVQIACDEVLKLKAIAPAKNAAGSATAAVQDLVFSFSKQP